MQGKSIVSAAEWVLAAIKNLEEYGIATIFHDTGSIKIHIVKKEVFDSIPLPEIYGKRNCDTYPFEITKQSGGISFFTILTAKEHIERLAKKMEEAV